MKGTKEEEVASVIPALPFNELMEWCMRVRIGEIKATPEIRAQAKAITFAQVYGSTRS